MYPARGRKEAMEGIAEKNISIAEGSLFLLSIKLK
jgi:hypothetical protein